MCICDQRTYAGCLRRGVPLLPAAAWGEALRSHGFEDVLALPEAGSPAEFVTRFDLASISGSHALGPTRMATESRVTTAHSHPFSTGLDLCLVHNGSLSNHNRLRRTLQREGIVFRTENDSEVAAGYLTWRLREGATLEQALEAGSYKHPTLPTSDSV